MHQIHTTAAVQAGGNSFAAPAAGVADFAPRNELAFVYHICSKLQRYIGILGDILNRAVGMGFDVFVYLGFIVAHFVVAILTGAEPCIGKESFTNRAVAQYGAFGIGFYHADHPFLTTRGVLLPCKDYFYYYNTDCNNNI